MARVDLSILSLRPSHTLFLITHDEYLLIYYFDNFIFVHIILNVCLKTLHTEIYIFFGIQTINFQLKSSSWRIYFEFFGVERIIFTLSF